MIGCEISLNRAYTRQPLACSAVRWSRLGSHGLTQPRLDSSANIRHTAMALRGADVDSDVLRSAGAGIYLNHYHRTRAWVGADDRSYAPGELLRGTAYLKNNPHPARRQLVLSQVDVYLSPECARRKRNFTHETRGSAARRQNLTDIYYVRRSGPAGSGTYRSFYHYGETVRRYLMRRVPHVLTHVLLCRCRRATRRFEARFRRNIIFAPIVS